MLFKRRPHVPRVGNSEPERYVATNIYAIRKVGIPVGGISKYRTPLGSISDFESYDFEN